MKPAPLFFLGVLAALVSPLYGQWTACSVGSNSLASLEKKGSNNFALTAIGTPLAGKIDMIAFASDQSKLFGDCEIVTRVAAVSSELKQNKQNWAAGIMMRETLSEGSRFIALACTNGHGVQSFIRSKTDADVTHQEICDCTVPYWLKIARQGDHLLTSKSSDGVIWIQIDDITFKMRHAVWVGLFSTSGGPAQIVVDFEHTGAHAIAAEKSG